MGKLGGREMTASSDLDLVFVYDVPDGVGSSDGAKPLSPTLYFARLAQRLIAALTTPTGAGTLYEVDMRLRPSGNKGPAAVSLKSFADYHARESWTWEHLALTRARLVAGPKILGARVEAEIATRLAPAARGAAHSRRCARDAGEDRRAISRPQSLGPEICAGRVDRHRIPGPGVATGPCARAARHSRHQHRRRSGEDRGGAVS